MLHLFILLRNKLDRHKFSLFAEVIFVVSQLLSEDVVSRHHPEELTRSDVDW